jgi:hypothetical protein
MQALTKLFWRNPAAAKPPRAWQPHEEDALLHAVRTVVNTQNRQQLADTFSAQVAAGEDPAALKGYLAEQLDALNAQEVAAEGRDHTHGGAMHGLHGAGRFSLMDWHTVAQHVGDRRVVLCQ